MDHKRYRKLYCVVKGADSVTKPYRLRNRNTFKELLKSVCLLSMNEAKTISIFGLRSSRRIKGVVLFIRLQAYVTLRKTLRVTLIPVAVVQA